MLSFLDFLNEKVNEQFLYHNTDFNALQNMFKTNKIGNRETNRLTGETLSMKPGWVSFTRNKRYVNAPGAGGAGAEVRLIYNYDKLKTRYKSTPHADLLVIKNRFTDEFVKGNESRWESEERFFGPITFDYALEQIQILKIVYQKKMSLISDLEEELEDDESMEKFKQGYFWHSPRQKYERFSDFPKANKEEKLQGIKNSQKNKNEIINKIRNIFSNPKVKIVDKFD